MSTKSLSSLLLFIGFAATRFNLATTARILGFFPSPSKSHLIIHAAVADTLAQAGHDVTIFGAAKNVYPNAKYKYIELEHKTLDNNIVTSMVKDSAPFYKQFGNLLKSIATSANDSITHPRVLSFLQEHGAGDFDLVIVGYFMNDVHFGLAAHFQCPLIVSFMIQPVMTVNRMVGNPTEFAYVPTLMAKQKQPMDFVARVKNLFAGIIEELVFSVISNNLQQKLYE